VEMMGREFAANRSTSERASTFQGCYNPHRQKRAKTTRFNVADYLVNAQMIDAYMSALLQDPSPQTHRRALAIANEARKRHRLPPAKNGARHTAVGPSRCAVAQG